MPYVEFLASEYQFDVLSRRTMVAFRAEQRDAGKLHAETTAQRLWLRNQTKRFWGAGSVSVTVDGVPERLLKTQFLERDKSKEPPTIQFRLSPNSLLSPGHERTRFPDGRVEVRRVDLDSYELGPGVVLRFDQHVYELEEEANRESQDRRFLVEELVAVVTQPLVLQSPLVVTTAIQPLVDDFLLVASLATDCRTGCMGWEFLDGACHAEEFSGNFGFPTGKKENNFRWGLWEGRKPRAAMLRHLWAAFQASEEKSLLRSAMWILIPGESRPVDVQFLVKFAVLEGLLQIQERKCRRYSVLSAGDWSALLPALQETIDTAPIGHPAEEAVKLRGLLKDKLPEINRPRPRASFEAFCRELTLDVSDLWIVFGSDARPGLYQIRNKLIHGLQVPAEAEEALFVAERNLHWVVTRMLLRIWGWLIQESAVFNKNADDHALQPSTIAKAQAELREAIRK